LEHPCCWGAQGQALPEDVARLFFQQIMVAVDYSHRMGVANRDIKLDNILLHRQVDLSF
jgi:serine/threonine-protein kinase SRK2